MSIVPDRNPRPSIRVWNETSLTPSQTLDLIERGYDFLVRIGAATDRDRHLFGDMIRYVTYRAVEGCVVFGDYDTDY